MEKELASADELTNTFFSAKNSKKELMRLRASKTLLQKDMAASNIPEAEYEKMLAEVETSISAQEKIVAAFMIEGKGMMNELNTKIANIETGIKDINMRSVKTLEKIKSMREDLGDYYETELQSLKQKRDELMKLNLPTMEIDIDIDWLTNKKDLAILFKQTYFGNREISDFSQRLKEVNQKIETLASKLHPGTNNTAESAKLVENK